MAPYPCPADVPWRAALDEALALAHRGQWLPAAERLAELTGQVGDAPAVWRNAPATKKARPTAR